MLMLPLWQYVGKRQEDVFIEWMSMEERLHYDKQLFRGNGFDSYLLIFNMLYNEYLYSMSTKQYFWIELFLEFTMKKK